MITPDLPPIRQTEFQHVQKLSDREITDLIKPAHGYLAEICKFIDEPQTDIIDGFPGEVGCNFFKLKNGEVELYLSTIESSGKTNYLYLVQIPLTNKLGIILDSKNPEVALFSACTTNHDGLSAVVVRTFGDGNLLVTPDFSQNQPETTICFNNINNPTELTFVDSSNNTAHATFIPPRSGNQGVFERGNTPFTVLLDGREVSIQDLVDSLKIQLAASDNLGVDDIDLKIISTTLNEESLLQSLEFTSPKPLLVETTIAPVKTQPPIHIATSAEIASTIFTEAQKNNQIRGNVISAIIDCKSEKCPNIYRVNDLSHPKVQKILSSIIEKKYLGDSFIGEIADTIKLSKKPSKFKIWLNNLFHRPTDRLAVDKLDAHNFHLECSIIPYIKETHDGRTLICFSPSGDLYIIQGKANEFNDLQAFLQRDYQVDPQGTNFLHSNEANLSIIPPASYQARDETEIFHFPADFRGDYSYDDLIFLGRELHAPSTGYLLNEETGELVVSEIPYGISGNYTGVTFFDESTSTTYVGITVTDIANPENSQQTYYIDVSEALLPIR